MKKKTAEIWEGVKNWYDEKFGEYTDSGHDHDGDGHHHDGSKSERKRLTDQTPTEEAVQKKSTMKSDGGKASHGGGGGGNADHGDHGDHESEYGPDLSMGFIRKSNPVRRFFDWLLHHRAYENFIVFLILLTSL